MFKSPMSPYPEALKLALQIYPKTGRFAIILDGMATVRTDNLFTQSIPDDHYLDTFFGTYDRIKMKQLKHNNFFIAGVTLDDD